VLVDLVPMPGIPMGQVRDMNVSNETHLLNLHITTLHIEILFDLCNRGIKNDANRNTAEDTQLSHV